MELINDLPHFLIYIIKDTVLLLIDVSFSDDIFFRPKFLTSQPFLQIWEQKIVTVG